MSYGPATAGDEPAAQYNVRRITFILMTTVSFVIFLTTAAMSDTLAALLAFSLCIVSIWELNQTREDAQAEARDNLDLTQACKREGVELDNLLKHPESSTVSRMLVSCLVKEFLETKQQLSRFEEEQGEFANASRTMQSMKSMKGGVHHPSAYRGRDQAVDADAVVINVDSHTEPDEEEIDDPNITGISGEEVNRRGSKCSTAPSSSEGDERAKRGTEESLDADHFSFAVNKEKKKKKEGVSSTKEGKSSKDGKEKKEKKKKRTVDEQMQE